MTASPEAIEALAQRLYAANTSNPMIAWDRAWDSLKDAHRAMARLALSPRAINQDLETPRMLVLSTGHVTRGTARDLEDYCNPGTLGEHRPRTVPIAFAKGEYGWIIAILPDREEDFARWTDDLLAIRKLAIEAGCTWIMLDRDADTVEGLPTYDW